MASLTSHVLHTELLGNTYYALGRERKPDMQ